MALEDKDIFNAIFNKYSDQPIEFIMEQYEKAKILRECPAYTLLYQFSPKDTGQSKVK